MVDMDLFYFKKCGNIYGWQRYQGLLYQYKWGVESSGVLFPSQNTFTTSYCWTVDILQSQTSFLLKSICQKPKKLEWSRIWKYFSILFLRKCAVCSKFQCIKHKEISSPDTTSKYTIAMLEPQRINLLLPYQQLLQTAIAICFTYNI